VAIGPFVAVQLFAKVLALAQLLHPTTVFMDPRPARTGLRTAAVLATVPIVVVVVTELEQGALLGTLVAQAVVEITLLGLVFLLYIVVVMGVWEH
jgi:hypothetical protein